MTRVAVLYQACKPPLVNGVRKPKKPGGYQDSGADIAYTLQQTHNQQTKDVAAQTMSLEKKKATTSTPSIEVVTPTTNPSPLRDDGWCFPDTEAGILAAIEGKGATLLWANTILFAAHPLQTSTALERYLDSVRVLAQPPRLVEAYDDKLFVHRLLRDAGIMGQGSGDDDGLGFTLPRVWTVETDTVDADLDRLTSELEERGEHSSYEEEGTLSFPVVAKPVRGRGSHGVKVCGDRAQLEAHVKGVLLQEDRVAMVEEFLAGEEATVTVMPPPSLSRLSEEEQRQKKPDHDQCDYNSHADTNTKGYWSLPVVRRFNHASGIAPYSGAVAVSANSRALDRDEKDRDPAYGAICRECEKVAALLGVTAPIRIDVRRRRPGRPNRDDQASLTALAAQADPLRWDYAELLVRMLSCARTLREVRDVELRAMS